MLFSGFYNGPYAHAFKQRRGKRRKKYMSYTLIIIVVVINYQKTSFTVSAFNSRLLWV